MGHRRWSRLVEGISRSSNDQVLATQELVRAMQRISEVSHRTLEGTTQARELIAKGADHLPITDARMTRFWITLDKGVDFVLTSAEMMQGGELIFPEKALNTKAARQGWHRFQHKRHSVNVTPLPSFCLPVSSTR